MSQGEIIIRPDAALVQRLSASPAEQFYDWERRGRGWQVWNAPAYLEPPFRPFVRYQLPPPPPVDDGRRHTWASALIEKTQRWLAGEKGPAREPEILTPGLIALFEEPAIPPYEDDEPLIELQVILPPGAKVTSDTFAAFLLSLSYCSCPLAFEVIGTAETITAQLVCRQGDAEQAEEQLLAHFPEARIKAIRGGLASRWAENVEFPAVVVDFGLSNEFMLPLKSLPAAQDPLVSITGALAKLREGEIGVLQVLFESVRHPWAESIFRAVTDDDGRPFFENAPEMVALAKQKIRSPLFAAVIRVAAKSEDEDRAWQIAKALGSGLAHLTNPTVNELIPLENEGYDDTEHELDLLRRLTHRGGMLLNTEELVSLVHLPTALVKSSKLVRQIGKTKAAPASATGHRLVLGMNEHAGDARTVTLSDDQRTKHMHVVGTSGTGKSTFLLNCILQDLEQGNGCAVLDPHGDLIDQVLARVPAHRQNDVILIDPSDAEFPTGFNILSAHSEIEKQLLSSDLVGIFRRLSTSWGDQMNSVLANAILAFLESERGGTLADLRRFLVEKSFRDEFLKTVADAECAYYWRKEFPMLTGGKSLGPLLTRLDTFLRPKFIRHMVAQRENKLDFGAIMNEGKIVLAKLAHGAIGEENSYLLGSLIVSKFHQIALARQAEREADRRPFYLYIDEFHNFITPSMAQILSGARKYRLGLILAHQEMRQLKNDEVAGAIIANPYTRVCFRLGDDDARKLESGFAFFEAKDLQNLGTGEAICRLERAEHDFNLSTPPLSEIESRLGEVQPKQTLIDLSRQRYATARAAVEAELAKARTNEEEDEPPPKKADRKKAEAAQEADLKTTLKTVLQEMAAEANAEPPPSAPSPTAPESAEQASPAPSEAVENPEHLPNAPPSLDEALRQGAAKGLKEPEPPPKPKVAPAIPSPLGRGGKEHQARQREIKQWAVGMGWQAFIEKPILDGGGSVDVSLERESLAVACEISVTTGIEQELGNLEKCLAAGYRWTASVCQDERFRRQLSAAARERFAAPEFSRLRFVSVDELKLWLESLQFEAAKTETVVGGRRVRADFAAPGKTDAPSRAAAFSDMTLKKIGPKKKE